MIRAIWLAAVAALLAVPLTVTAQENGPPKKTFLWEVRDQDPAHTLYIFAGPGLGNGDLYPLSVWAEAAYGRSQVLAVESDLSDEKRFAKETAGMFYPEGDSIEAHISKSLYDEVNDFHAAQALPFEPSSHLKPYALALGLMNKEARKIGLDPSFDAPFYFLAKAEADKKPVVEIEGVAQELGALDRMPIALQEEMLKSAVELSASGDWAEALQNEVSAWKSGDIAYYTELELKSYATMPHGADVRHALVEVRNAPIADKLATYLKSGKIHFAVLTAPHLIGPDNLIDELVKRGYKVQRL